MLAEVDQAHHHTGPYRSGVYDVMKMPYKTGSS